jgi:ABC-type dipeptide/oligopeptide/nickel transport system permease component
MRHLLMISSSDYERIGQDPAILSIMKHELGHGNVARTNPGYFDKGSKGAASMSERRLDELHADRYADLPVGEVLLSIMTNDAKNSYVGYSGVQRRPTTLIIANRITLTREHALPPYSVNLMVTMFLRMLASLMIMTYFSRAAMRAAHP